MREHPMTFPAADGTTARLRLPGGRVGIGTWDQLADLAELGDGRLQLTSRGNLQVRGLNGNATFSDTGFTDGPSIIASPLARLDPLVDALTTRLADHVDPSVSSRLLLGIDDGSGDILAESPDLGLQLNSEGARLIRSGQLIGGPDATEAVLDQVVDAAARHTPDRPRETTGADTHRPPVGWLAAADGSVTLGAGLRLGVLDAQVARMLGVIGVATTVTPWRSLLIHDLTESVAEQVVRVLAPLGLIFDENSPWLHISACVGSPSCAQAVSDTRADARQAAASGIPGRLHFVGCSRNCGRPRQSHTLYQASGDGEYEVVTAPEN